MALEDYRKKRDFKKTPEPSGDAPLKKKTKGDEFFFCVQKHLASHLHYDFRLEWNGVLLSWAVPKGPSIDPKDKRLAMQTEDHPYDYGMFEGVIPEGYGAGIVMLWDYGTWEPESEDVDAALRKGDLKFRLNGFKLKGSWVLVRTKGGYAGNRGQEGRSWLLIKHRDEWASGELDIAEFAPLSVKSEGDFAEILSQENPDIWRSNRPAQGGETGAMFDKIIAQAMQMRARESGGETRDSKAGPRKARAAKAKTPKATTAKKSAIRRAKPKTKR